MSNTPNNNHRAVEIERNLWRSPGLTSLYEQSHIDQAVQDYIHSDSEYGVLQRLWTTSNIINLLHLFLQFQFLLGSFVLVLLFVFYEIRK